MFPVSIKNRFYPTLAETIPIEFLYGDNWHDDLYHSFSLPRSAHNVWTLVVGLEI
jgi:hypothetical protein